MSIASMFNFTNIKFFQHRLVKKYLPLFIFTLGIFCLYAFLNKAEAGYSKRVTFAESNEISDGLCKLFYLMTSSVLKIVCVFVLVVTALGFFLGKISWGMIISIAVAVAVIFSSESLLVLFVGKKAEGGCKCKAGVAGPACKAKP
jgi:type IV secretory pathway VirB2 component (pilin)